MRLKTAGFIVGVALGVISAAFPAEAQQAARGPRIGWLSPGSPASDETFLAAFLEGLRKLGYVDARKPNIEQQFAEGKTDRLPTLAADLVSLKVDVFMLYSTPAAQAAKSATQAIPIVCAAMGDPVGSGLVASLARPGGNLTGLSLMAPELSGKRLELIRETVPKASRVAMLWNSGNSAMVIRARESQSAAQVLGVTLQSLGVRDPDELARTFAAMTRQRPDVLLTLIDPFTHAHRKRIVDFAAENRLPAIYESREFVDAGGLMSYGPSLPDQFRRAATYVDKILKGAKPADLPVEQPTRFELVINLKTAKALELTMPQSILIRTDQVIQ